jgi:16S rRNA (cytidine1402-2'-O)-methyltransferase
MGDLYVVSTPIGNLEDMTLRAIRVLGEVAAVLAEDTRRTGVLLRHFHLRTPLLSYHRHNEEARGDEVLERLASGEDLALVSDAGTPLVSDPGERLTARVLEAGHRVIPIPGPSAALAALVASGLPAIPFAFLGFVPRKGREREAFLERVAGARETTVFFESPERTGVLLEELATRTAPAREAAVARELTKVHEEVRRGTLPELARYYGETPPRGEVTLVLSPTEPGEPGEREEVDEAAIRALGSALLSQGERPSRAAREVARRLGVPRNQAYRILQELDALPPEREGER